MKKTRKLNFKMKSWTYWHTDCLEKISELIVLNNLQAKTFEEEFIISYNVVFFFCEFVFMYKETVSINGII